jgi:hypothetical protein
MKPILHLYESRERCITAFHESLDSNKNNVTLVKFRDLMYYTEESIVYFKYFKDYSYAKANELSSQWGEIYFYLDLPLNIKNHYLSRIRWIKQGEIK